MNWLYLYIENWMAAYDADFISLILLFMTNAVFKMTESLIQSATEYAFILCNCLVAVVCAKLKLVNCIFDVLCTLYKVQYKINLQR